jgi:hypothetical protein
LARESHSGLEAVSLGEEEHGLSGSNAWAQGARSGATLLRERAVMGRGGPTKGGGGKRERTLRLGREGGGGRVGHGAGLARGACWRRGAWTGRRSEPRMGNEASGLARRGRG